VKAGADAVNAEGQGVAAGGSPPPPRRRGTADSVGLRLTVVLSVLLLPLVLYGIFSAWPLGPYALWPIAVWLIALAVVWLIIETQVSRPVRRLTRIAQAYSLGDLAPRPPMNGPADLRALAATLGEMTARIASRERELSEAIETREAMLREIHHRVKNNLQIVTSLLNLQAKAVQGDSARRAFSEIQTRVRALALVHRYLYESDDLQSVNLGAFLTELAASLQLAYGISEEQVAIEVKADEVWDIADRAVPLALFMTEAMTNALKHAFPQGRRGVVRIVLKALPDGIVQFCVEDNGVGLSDAQTFAEGRQASLGMSLIKAFARQVEGKLTISGPPGTVVSIEFVNKIRQPAKTAPAPDPEAASPLRAEARR
jgi:two-component sensor histidine kinase